MDLIQAQGNSRRMMQATGTEPVSKSQNAKTKLFHRRTFYESVLLFVGSGVLLFLLSSRVVNIFDEGCLLTGAMRTMAGQVVHRDFYYNYGPGQLYILAGLFKLFGSSVLVERLTDIFFDATVVVSWYALAKYLCNRAIAVVVALICVMWLIGLMMTESVMNPALCTLIIWTAWLILPVRDDRQQRRRSLAAGFLTAIIFLFRYDVAFAVAVANFAAVAIINWLQEPGSRRSPRRLLATVFGPYLAIFFAIAVPAAIGYLSVAPLHDLLYDTVLYGAHAYRLGRQLPFPKLALGPTFEDLAVYLLLVILALGLGLIAYCAIMRRRTAANKSASCVPDWVNPLVAFSTMAALMYMRGLVRLTIGHLNVSLMPCLLIAALLFQHRAVFNVWLRSLLMVTLSLFVLTAISSAQNQLFDHSHLRPLAINWIVTPNRQPPGWAFRSWCSDGTPITRGFCYLVSDDRIETIRYLNAHTRSQDYLYVGLSHHDRILMNDNIIYFAVQRLPAVRWSQLDPFVENLADIQEDMIGGFEQHKPPYIVLDSEFENEWEPNGSAVSTGVHLLDDYIATHYKTVQQYGPFAILQRQR